MANKFNTWLKRFGVLGFLFFFIKGLVWLFILYGLGTGVKSCGASTGKIDTEEKSNLEKLELPSEEKDSSLHQDSIPLSSVLFSKTKYCDKKIQ